MSAGLILEIWLYVVPRSFNVGVYASQVNINDNGLNKECITTIMVYSVGITAFFNLKKAADSTSLVRPEDFYKKNCEATLSVQSPLVIFCDTETRSWIEPLRETYAPLIQTIYVEKKITDYDFFRENYTIIEENRKENPPLDKRNTVSFCLLTVFKFVALKKATELLPNASHYIWVDFGAQHIAWKAKEYLQKVFDNPKPKIAVNYIRYRSKNEVSDMKSFMPNYGPCSIAANMITVESNFVYKLHNRAMSVFYEQLANGVGHNEEAVLVYLFDRWPELFSIYYGDYYSTFSNYHEIVRDHSAIRWHFIQNAWNAGRKDLATVAAKALLASPSLEANLSIEDINALKQMVNE